MRGRQCVTDEATVQRFFLAQQGITRVLAEEMAGYTATEQFSTIAHLCLVALCVCVGPRKAAELAYRLGDQLAVLPVSDGPSTNKRSGT